MVKNSFAKNKLAQIQNVLKGFWTLIYSSIVRSHGHIGTCADSQLLIDPS